MNLYKNAFENYTEKIEEIEGYKSNKHLTDDAKAAKAAKAAQYKIKKEELKDKNDVFKEKTDDISIARADRRDVENKLKDFDINNDKKLKGLNRELYKNKFNIGDKKPAEAIENIKSDVGNLLDTKKDLRKELSDLKSKENEARSAIKNIGADMKSNFISNLGKKLPDMQNIKKLGNKVNNNISDMFDKVKI
jgi:hypothetical protein